LAQVSFLAQEPRALRFNSHSLHVPFAVEVCLLAMFGVGWKLPLVSEEFASIDSEGQLVFREPTDDESSRASQAEKVELLDPAKASQTNQKELEKVNSVWCLQKWLAHLHAADPSCDTASAALKKLQSRRLDDALCGNDMEMSGHLNNAIHWLEQMAGAITLLQELRKDHDRMLHSSVAVPIGDATSGILSEWAACKAQDVLAEVLPELVDQVIAYHEHIAVRSCKGRDQEKLQAEVDRMSDKLREEKRRANYYFQKFRELQQAQNLKHSLDISKVDTTTNDFVDDVPIHTEADLQEMNRMWEAKLEALEKEWQDLLDEERKKAQALQDSLRAEINALKAQIEALRRELEALRAREHRSQTEVAEEEHKRSSDPIDLIDRKASSRPTFERASVGGTSPSRSPRSPSRNRSDARTTVVHSAPSPGSERRYTIDEASTFGRCMPPSSRLKKDWMLLSDEDAQRRMAEELKRKVFEKVLNEERRRQALVDEEDQAALAARFESQGWGELINLIRRVDDTILRRDIFRLLKLYQKRSNPALEVVCVFCRRKPRPDQIHTYDVTSRPMSAANRASYGTLADTAHALPDSVAQPLPRVSSSPSVVLGLPKGTKSFQEFPHAADTLVRQDVKQGRHPKLVAVLPTAALKPSKTRPRSAPAPMGLPSANRAPSSLPPGWAITNAAC